jgi:hypothetical protein
MSIHDWHISHEVQRQFDEFITDPDKTDVLCPRCQTYVEQARMPTETLIVAYRCKCGVEAVLLDEYKKLDPEDWHRITHAI